METSTIKNSPQLYARIAAVLLFISIFAGGFGEMFVLQKFIVNGDANATAHNILSSDWFFRFGFASYLTEAICDVTLIWVFYLLLKPVNQKVALLTVFFGLVSTITFAFAELFYIAARFILHAEYLKSFSTDQINSLALLSLKLYGYGSGVFMAFYGIATLLRGYLIFQSDYLPKSLGVLLMVSGACFVLGNFLLLLAPEYNTGFLLLPTVVAVFGLSFWLLIKGVDMDNWRAMQGT
jgi:hypothetical protein